MAGNQGSVRVAKRIAEKRLALRREVWPDLDEKRLWLRTKAKGFTTVPRTLPLVLRILDSLSLGRPLASTYLDLWCRAHDECIVEITNPTERAFYASFVGQRAVQTWEGRMKQLISLGFIDAKPGPHGPYSYVLLWNPHLVARDLRAKIGEALYHALTARLIEIGAEDFEGDAA